MQAVTKIADDYSKLSRQELIEWVNPVVSGLLLGTGVFLYLVLWWGEYTILTLGCRLFQIGLVLTFVAGFIVGKVPKKDVKGIEQEVQALVESVTPVVVSTATTFFFELNKVLRWEPWALSFRWLCTSALISCIFGCFDITTLLFLFWFGIFTIPMGYKMNKATIDPILDNAQKTIRETAKKVPQLEAFLGWDKVTKEE
eukprot:TRINITY_DN812_c0_g2_i1.p1 TRINITY_DN812_c0_g2~~TRINITY_DN812_c0_g2_i1.p1  ORF type:complete len:199 (+),score=35.21 TRINITY_DN812_c0_g2_i1:48-644(+)